MLRVDQVAQIGAQVADALAATHAAGIVHRDVKPANILIGEGGRVEGLVKITDFGISHASGDVTLTQTGQITGTPAFLAPEVAQGHPMTEASDVFSLGRHALHLHRGPAAVRHGGQRARHAAQGGRRADPAAAAGRLADRAAAADAGRRSGRPAARCPRSATSWPSSPPAATATPRRCCSRAPTCGSADRPGRDQRTSTCPAADAAPTPAPADAAGTRRAADAADAAPPLHRRRPPPRPATAGSPAARTAPRRGSGCWPGSSRRSWPA